MPGPLPDPDAQRTNIPTIPTTKIPAGGRRGAVPDPPAWMVIGPVGMQWWEWAWRTPEACAWDDGQLVKVAHRASLEDDLSLIGDVQNLDVDELLDAETTRDIRMVISRLASIVTGRQSILTQISALDDRLGLSPKGRDNLRLKVVADSDYYPAGADSSATKKPGVVTEMSSRRKRVTDDAT